MPRSSSSAAAISGKRPLRLRSLRERRSTRWSPLDGEAADAVELALVDPGRVGEALVGQDRLHDLHAQPPASSMRAAALDRLRLGGDGVAARVGFLVAALDQQPLGLGAAARCAAASSRRAASRPRARTRGGRVERVLDRAVGQRPPRPRVPDDHARALVVGVRRASGRRPGPRGASRAGPSTGPSAPPRTSAPRRPRAGSRSASRSRRAAGSRSAARPLSAGGRT